jgi:hypothetical protein
VTVTDHQPLDEIARPLGERTTFTDEVHEDTVTEEDRDSDRSYDQHYEGAASVPQYRQSMTFGSRYDYTHYYRMPAHVGMQNVPGMIHEMVREGIRLQDIQITFDVEEIK